MKTSNLLFPSPSAMAAITASARILALLLLISTTANSTFFLPERDINLLEFPLNLEYLEAEHFLSGAFGFGLDAVEPGLAAGGPPPIGAKQANLSPVVKDIITQFGYQKVGHIKAIKKTVGGFPRPLLNLSSEAFATVIDAAFGVNRDRNVFSRFDPYANDINYLISCYVISYLGLTGYVGANPQLISPVSSKLVAGLLGVEAGQDAVIRSLLYERAKEKVHPYNVTVAEFTQKISQLRDNLGKSGLKDEGLYVPIELGAERKVEGNVLAGDEFSVAYGRKPEEILRIMYGTGDERTPGGFYPKGGDGAIAKSYL